MYITLVGMGKINDEIKASGMPFRILKYLEENDPNLDLVSCIIHTLNALTLHQAV